MFLSRFFLFFFYLSGSQHQRSGAQNIMWNKIDKILRHLLEINYRHTHTTRTVTHHTFA